MTEFEEEKWKASQDKARKSALEEDRKNTRRLIIGLVIAGIFVVFVWPHTFSWDGEGEVSLFPNTDNVKNYRLTATMDVTQKKHGWIHSSYTLDIDEVSWPNGGTSEFSDCIVVENEKATCTDQDDNEYLVEVNEWPERPEAEYDSDY